MASTETPTKILFVEDDERLAKLTVRYLESSGFIVTWVATGPKGMAEATQRQYDVVLLDVMLPGRDGGDVCRELRAHSDVPIIMVTARKDEVDRILGLDGGADDYVKPGLAQDCEAPTRSARPSPSARWPARVPSSGARF